MLTWTEYFRPDNPIALAIVYILWCVFVIWIFSLVRGGARIGRHGRAIQALIRVTPALVAARLDRQDRRNRGLGAERTPSDEFRAQLPPEVAHDEPVAIHLENIYAAGCSESRLDIGELLSNTERMITQGDSARLHFLSIFLIIGLLGTLFGLADSILALLRLLKQDADVGSNLAALLGSLKGAFAPSISGVMTSIVGTGVYAFYNRVYVSPLIGQLREATINFWVPELYPTTGQIAAEAAQRSLDAAVKVTDSAQHIREDTVKLAATLKSAVEDTGNYATAIDKLSVTIKAATEPAVTALAGLATQLARFDEAMSRWAQFERTLQTLHEELTANQKMLAANSAEMVTLIGSQTDRLGKMSSGLEITHQQALKDVGEKFQELSERMSTLQVPFKDAVEQMLNQNQLLSNYADTQLRGYREMLDMVVGLPDAVVRSTSVLAEKIAQGMQALEEARQHPPAEPWEAVRRELTAGFGEQNLILKEVIESVRALNRAPAQRPGKGTFRERPSRQSDGATPQFPPFAAAAPSYPEPPPPGSVEYPHTEPGYGIPQAEVRPPRVLPLQQPFPAAGQGPPAPFTPTPGPVDPWARPANPPPPYSRRAAQLVPPKPKPWWQRIMGG